MRNLFFLARIRASKVPVWAWLISIALLAMALRFISIGSRSLWFDEAISALAARFDLATIATQRLDPMAPPLYFLLLSEWVRAFSALGLTMNESVLRGFSAAFSVIAIWPVYLIGRRMYSLRVGLFAALLMAVLPFQVSFGQEVRAYGLVIFCAAVVMWLFLLATEHNRHLDWIILGCVCLVGVYVHYLMSLLVAAQHVYLLSRRSKRALLKRMLWVDAILALGLLPIASGILYQSTQLDAAFKLGAPSILEPLITVTFLLFGYTNSSTGLVLSAFFISLALLGVLIFALVRRPGPAPGLSWFLLSIIVIPMLVLLALSYIVRPIYFDRYFAFTSPALVIFLAQGLDRQPKWLIRFLLAGLLVFSAIKLIDDYTQFDPARPPFREASAYILSAVQPGDIVFHVHDSTFASFRFYAPDVNAVLWKDDSAGWLVPSAWKWFGTRISDLSALFAGHRRIWIMSLPDTLDDSRRSLIAQINQRYPRILDQHFDNIEVGLYAAPSTP